MPEMKFAAAPVEPSEKRTPTKIETPLNAETRANNPQMVEKFMEHTPLGRPGTPEDIAGPAVFLASDLSAYVTGSMVMADGGYRTV